MHLDHILDRIHPLPPPSKAALERHITSVHHPKGHILLQAHKVEPSIYFIQQGIVRAYATSAEGEITFWFGKEGDPVLSMRSYVQNQSGYEDIVLLEDSQLYQLSIPTLQTLFTQDIHIANWGRRLAEQELIKTEERLISRQVKTATERYRTLLHEQPQLLQRVPLIYIAAYLGITPVSLSRIRAEIR